MYQNFQDQFGFIHLNENPTNLGSENGPLFTPASYLLMALNNTPNEGMPNPKYYLLKKSSTDFVTEPLSPRFRFSHDNMTGLYIARELGFHSMDLPICRWSVGEGRPLWYHPRDLIFYAALSNHKLGLALLPILLVISIFSYKKPKAVTSGKCLWFYRFGVLSLSKSPYKSFIGKVGLGMGELLLKAQHGSKGFLDVFSIYFKNKNHPINKEIAKYYV